MVPCILVQFFYMYHFNECFYRKGINLRSLAEKKIIRCLFLFSLYLFFASYFPEQFHFGNMILVSFFCDVDVVSLVPNDHMLGSEHFDHFAVEVNVYADFFFFWKWKTKAIFWAQNWLFFLKWHSKQQQAAVFPLKDEIFTGFNTYKYKNRQKHEVTKRKITVYLSFEPNNWLVMLMDQIYSKMSSCQAIIYREFYVLKNLICSH